MSIWNQNPVAKTRTAPHVRLIEILYNIGFYVTEELPVGKYFLDCYLKDGHLGFEADGPTHSRMKSAIKKDAARDAWILENAGIPIMRITADALMKKSMEANVIASIQSFMDEWWNDLDERCELADRNGFEWD